MSVQYVFDDQPSSDITNASGDRAISKYTPNGGKIVMRAATVINGLVAANLNANPVQIVAPVAGASIVVKAVSLQLRGVQARAAFGGPATVWGNTAVGAIAAAGPAVITYAAGANVFKVGYGNSVALIEANQIAAAPQNFGTAAANDVQNLVITPTFLGATPINTGVFIGLHAANLSGGGANTNLMVIVDYEVHAA